MKKRMVSLLLVVMLIFTMLVSGCSNDSKTNPDSNKSTSSEQKTEVNEVKIGLMGTLTGSMAESGKNSSDGFNLAVKDINAAGGIKALGGAKVVVVEADNGSSDPALGASVARRLITEDKVVALAGCYASGMTLQASTEAEKYQVPMISQSFVDQLTSRGYKYFFQLPSKASINGEKSIEYALDLMKTAGKKIERIAIIASNDANPKQQAEAQAKVLKEMGMNVVMNDLYPLGLTDATALATKIKNAKPDILFAGGSGVSDVVMIVRSLRSIGVNCPIVSGGGGSFLLRGFGEGLGSNIENVFANTCWNWDLKYEGLSKVSEAYNKEYNQPFMPQEAGEMYIAAWILKDAIEKAGSADPVAIRDALATYDSSEGVAGMMTGGGVKFDSTGWNEKSLPVMIQWVDQKPITVWPKEYAVTTPVFK